MCLECHGHRPQDKLVQGLCGTCAWFCCRVSNVKRNSTARCALQQQHAFWDKRRCKACEAKLRTGGSPNVASVTGQQTKRIRVHADRSKCRITIVKHIVFPKRRCTVGTSSLANQVSSPTEGKWKWHGDFHSVLGAPEGRNVWSCVARCAQNEIRTKTFRSNAAHLVFLA